MAGSDPLEDGLPAPPPTAPPDAVRAAIKARVLAASLGKAAEPARLGGRYRLVREIGRGGIGTVWEAELEPIGRKVAIKLLRARRGQQTEAGKRLVREAVKVSQIGHPHIVAVHDVGTDDAGAPYLVMDLLHGQSLASLLEAGALPWADVQVIAEQICSALAAAHDLGVVHRDVKPANVFVRRTDGGGWHSTLLDFGLCKASDDTTALTAQGMLLGTPGYMAPEQIRGEHVDARADVYAVACVVVEMLGGRPAFRGPRREDILAAQLAGDHATLPAALPSVAREVLQRALSVEPDARPISAAELRQALLATSLARTEVASIPDAPTGTRRRYVVGVVSVVAFVSGIVLVGGSRRDAVESKEDASTPTPVAPEPREPEPPPPAPRPEAAVVVEPLASEPVATAPSASEPVTAPPTKPIRRRRPRAERDAEPPEPDAPRPEPKPKRPLVDGIRDPFAE